MRCENFHGRER